MGFPGSSDGKESACNTGDLGSIPGLGRSPGEGTVTHSWFLPGEFHGQRSLAGYSPWGHRELDTTEQITQTPYIIKIRCLLWMYVHLFDPYRTPSFTTLRPKDSGRCTHSFIHSFIFQFVHSFAFWMTIYSAFPVNQTLSDLATGT